MKHMTRYRFYVGMYVDGVPIAPSDRVQRIDSAAKYLADMWGGVTHFAAQGRWEDSSESTIVFEVLTDRLSPHHRLAYAAAENLKLWFDQKSVLWTAEAVDAEFV